jgi:hypothetical protein
VPHYPGTPIRGHDDVVPFFDWLRQKTLTLFAERSWDVLTLDALGIPVEGHTNRLLRLLESKNDQG